MAQAKVFQLKCAVQTYAWGKPGSESEVASLSASGNDDFIVDQNTPYAELWMGTHPKGPAVIVSSGESLSDWVRNNQGAVGQKVFERFPTAGQLPFLFKVLSVNKSLSIQAHPNKVLAEMLHAENPDKYPDANHKPEMAIALTPFEGLCGFRPKEEIVGFLNNIPEFKAICGEANADAFISANGEQETQSTLKKCFSALMNSDEAAVKSGVESLAARLSEQDGRGESTAPLLGDLFLRLNSQYPGDGGCFVIYFLNRMLLQPGESMFLEANLPHAYLSGDCMECMACSDNVVRAGLTPKFKDVPTLCSMLNYTCKPSSENLFPSVQDAQDPFVTIYNPPIPDFTVNRIQIPSGTASYDIRAVDSASILLVIKGEASASSSSASSDISLRRGTIVFISAGESLNLSVTSAEGMLLFQAYCFL